MSKKYIYCQKNRCHFTWIGCESILIQFIGDDYCDDENNNAECQFDNGDCCGSNVNTKYCTECQCLSDEGSIGGNWITTPSLTTNL